MRKRADGPLRKAERRDRTEHLRRAVGPHVRREDRPAVRAASHIAKGGSNGIRIRRQHGDVDHEEGIETVVFDTHASVMDGSMGFLPRRLMVLDEDFARAETLLREAVPDAMP